jgi:hypothetical protein
MASSSVNLSKNARSCLDDYFVRADAAAAFVVEMVHCYFKGPMPVLVYALLFDGIHNPLRVEV